MFNMYNKKYMKMHTWMNFMFQDSSSPNMEWLFKFHDYTLLINLLITMTISYLMMMIFMNKFISSNINNQFIEIIWTVLPMIILLFLAFPSLKILYMMDSIFKPLLTIKCLGHQWFWSYQIADFSNVEFDSTIMLDSNKMNHFRLLDVNNRLILPMNLQIRLLISSEDVIHSFTVPSMGIKVDGIPGRLNQINLMINRPGMYFGQCSEICGANHSFMPICIEATNLKFFMKWIEYYF
uniref:Cytochrome c oxidase subunit 2 n=1 Tax=Oberthuerella sharkeyi TaxID=2943459 RepID=A0A9E8G742_9HYME|nr:cytochrome c oxidase subunit 2 [Oberthuerella sharkeyi]